MIGVPATRDSPEGPWASPCCRQPPLTPHPRRPLLAPVMPLGRASPGHWPRPFLSLPINRSLTAEDTLHLPDEVRVGLKLPLGETGVGGVARGGGPGCPSVAPAHQKDPWGRMAMSLEARSSFLGAGTPAMGLPLHTQAPRPLPHRHSH